MGEQLAQATDVSDVPITLDRGRLWTALTANSFWLVYEFPTSGKLAIRTCFDPQLINTVTLHRKTKTVAEYHVNGALGLFRVRIELHGQQPALLQYTTSLELRQSLSIQAFPPDVYVLDDDFSPITTEGMVYVTQSGPTAGLAYLSVTKPLEGSLLYFQNFTALTDYCQTTRTEPSGTVTVQWPEIGFTLPTSEEPLPADKEIVLSDAFLCLSDIIPTDEFDAADLFLESLASIYRKLPRPETTYYDWPKAADRTVQALTESPDCGRIIKNRFYLNAYVGANQKPPESMVQFAMLVPLWEYQNWLGQPVPLLNQLQESVHTFYDETKSTMVRWLPGETFGKDETSEEEDHDKIDSWYLLHTLMNLGRLADMGNVQAKELLLRSIDFVINAAHHFEYNWPVFYDSQTLQVVKAETDEGKGGELDVAGLFTHVMLQVYELTKDPRFLTEAKASAERLQGKGFELLYQSNITIMSALTLAKLWKITGNRLYINLSKLSIANVFARLWMWECNFGFGQQWSTFLGVAPLKNADYLAAYEEGEIMATILSYLNEVGTDVPESIRLIFAEYIRYLLHRGRYYFPSELSADMISQQPREGYIDPKLPIPLEDLPTGWKQAGTVGQEVYGGALAYILTTYMYKRFKGMPLTLYCDYPIYQAEYELSGKGSGYAIFRLAGTADYTCRLCLLPRGRQLPLVSLFDERDDTNEPLMPTGQDKNYVEYQVPGNLWVRVEWMKSR